MMQLKVKVVRLGNEGCDSDATKVQMMPVCTALLVIHLFALHCNLLLDLRPGDRLLFSNTVTLEAEKQMF